MKISNMDGDWQKKKLRGVCGECQSPNCNRVGCTPSDVTIQDDHSAFHHLFKK